MNHSAAIETSIVIVNWNSRELLRACLASLRADLADPAFEVVVVDSGSFDGASEMLRDHFPAVRFIQSTVNLGFGRASNLGARESRGQTLIFLNPDTVVPDLALHRLSTRLAMMPKAGLLGCRLVNADGSLQLSCVQALPSALNQCLNAHALLQRFPQLAPWTSALTFEDCNAPVPVDAVAGACMVISRDLFCELGGFSPDYFMYVEDLDLCHRVRAAGREVVYVPEVGITHLGGGTTGKDSTFSSVMTHEALLRYFRKTRGDVYASFYRVACLACVCFRLTVLLTVGVPAWIGGRGLPWRRSFKKWISIGRWSLGLDRPARRFDGLPAVDPRSSGDLAATAVGVL